MLPDEDDDDDDAEEEDDDDDPVGGLAPPPPPAAEAVTAAPAAAAVEARSFALADALMVVVAVGGLAPAPDRAVGSADDRLLLLALRSVSSSELSSRWVCRRSSA